MLLMKTFDQSFGGKTEHREVKRYLARFKVKDCSCIGVDDSLKIILANLGIVKADQIDENALRHIDSLKPAQLAGLFAWRNYLLAQGRVRSPKRLTGIERKRVVDRWHKRRAEVQEKNQRARKGVSCSRSYARER